MPADFFVIYIVQPLKENPKLSIFEVQQRNGEGKARAIRKDGLGRGGGGYGKGGGSLVSTKTS